MISLPSETDIVVVGSGLAGLAGALTAAETGAKVVVLEKERSPGGTSNFVEGTFAVESEMQRKQYITFTRDQSFKDIMDYSHWRANPRLVRAVVNESAATIAWLLQHGVEFIEVTINMPEAPRTYHVIKGKGEAIIKALVTHCKSRGVDIRLATPAKRLLKQGDKVSGVVAEIDGDEKMIRARSVIIASGGFGNNKEWIKKYSGFDLGVNLLPVGNVDKTGDGIRMAFEAGAAEEGIGVLELYRVGPVAPEFAMGCQLEAAATQPDLWVDPRGERFCDETIGFYDTSVGNANARLKEGFSYTLFDDTIIRRMQDRGIDKNVAVANPPGTRPLDLQKEMTAALEHGSADFFAADSVAGLAAKMGISPSILRSTVDEYNEFCRKGHDDLFAKDPRYLWPLQGPQFYAVKARTVFLGTMGGIKINEKAEALDKKGNPIPGLFAAGFDAGGMYGDSYPMKTSSGLASAFALNSGRIAGKSAKDMAR